MGFHGYGGSELDHSDCLIYPCSECRRQRGQPHPSVRSGNTSTNPTSNPNDRWSRVNVFGYENSDSNAANRATGADTYTAADNTEDLSGGFHRLAISDGDRTLRDEMRQSGFRIPPTPEDPTLRHPEGSQNRSEVPGFQPLNQPEPSDGRSRLSDEGRALRDEMRRSGFRIPSVSDDPALSRPDGGQDRNKSAGFQAQNQYQANNDGLTAATGSVPLGSYPAPSPCSSTSTCVCQSNFGQQCGCSPNSNLEILKYSNDIVAPWASDHPTTEDTLRRVLRNKWLASQGRSQEFAGNFQTSNQPESSAQGATGRSAVPRIRLARPDGSEMELDEAYD
ncbi:hypothetical protein V501_03828 [Pseudogymnoascus sp. VKM F-4519 (FW-2642)]|nr:hypothetical protein V501_03828 [Pseudogymnoascus sp. VKM F-4519 (FW-2642)]